MRIYKRIAALFACAFFLFSSYALAELKEGDKSDDVKKLQSRLVALKYLPSDTELSRHFGALTKAGVEAFQKRSGLKATGVLDSKTEKAVYGKNAKKAKTPVELPKQESVSNTAQANNQSNANILLSGDLSQLEQLYPELKSNPDILRNNPGLAEQLLARQAALNALGGVTTPAASLPVASAYTPASSTSVPSGSNMEDVIQFGMTLLGRPYRNGGRGPDSFDCSGFVCYILGQYGYPRPGSSQDISDYSGWVTISDRSQLIRGDIVLFHTSGRNISVGHSGIYLGDGTFLHAEPSNGVTVTSMSDYNSRGEKTYYNANYLWAKRIP